MPLAFDLRRAIHESLSISCRTHTGTRKLLAYLMDLLDCADFRIIEQAAALSDADSTNLVGRRGPGGPGGLLLCTSIYDRRHFCFPLWSETEEDPYNPTERDGLLFAAGAAGGKVDLICKILAAARVEQAELVRPVIVAGLFGEGSRVGGPMYLLDSGVCSPEWALVGEPTNLELVYAHRGYLVLEVDVDVPQAAPPAGTGRTFQIDVLGEGASSAAPQLGHNAVEAAFKQVALWRARGAGFTTHDFRGEAPSAMLPDSCRFYLHTEHPHWFPRGPHLMVEELRRAPSLGPAQDTALDVWRDFRARLHELFRWTASDTAPDFFPSVPIHAVTGVASDGSTMRLRFDYRTLPGQRVEQLVRDIDALARRTSNPNARVRVRVERNLLPMDAEADGVLLQGCRAALREVGVPPVVATYAGYAEGWIFDAAQIETTLFGPGDALAAASRPNEHSPLIQIERAAAFYERVIRRLCCG